MILNHMISMLMASVSCIAGIGVSLQEKDVEVPDGFEHQVIGRQPLIQDPVAFTVDPDGRILIAETERTNHGAMDNRSSPWHLEDDLQSMTVEDRIAFMEKGEYARACRPDEFG